MFPLYFRMQVPVPSVILRTAEAMILHCRAWHYSLYDLCPCHILSFHSYFGHGNWMWNQAEWLGSYYGEPRNYSVPKCTNTSKPGWNANPVGCAIDLWDTNGFVCPCKLILALFTLDFLFSCVGPHHLSTAPRMRRSSSCSASSISL